MRPGRRFPGCTGRPPTLEQRPTDPATRRGRAAADRHFTLVLSEPICAAVDLDVLALNLAGWRGVRREWAAWSEPV
jgi:hypothetical protein